MEEKKIDLNEIIEIAKRVSELNEAGILDFDTFDTRVQMSGKAFNETFKDREDVITDRKTRATEYPYHYSVREQDVEFFCISREPLELDKVYG